MSRAKARPKRMLWFRIRDAGNYLWRVWLVDECDRRGDTDLPKHLVGITHPDTREIEISIHQPSSEIVNTLMHELMHGAGGTRSTPVVVRTAEELYIQRAECSMWRFMAQLGARVPTLPPGVKLSSSRKRKAS